jgi:hypothetical protein
LALQLVEALLADAQKLDLFAFRDQPEGVVAGEAHDRRIECAAKAALGRADDEEMDLVLPCPDHQRRSALAVLQGGHEVGEHRFHAGCVRPGRLGGVLSAPELRRGHHLHGLGDLLRRLHA